MRFTVTVELDVDLDAYREEYLLGTAAEALVKLVPDLREQGWYFQQEKWRGLANVKGVKAQLDLFSAAEAAKVAVALSE
jgi:hypothetical protein